MTCIQHFVKQSATWAWQTEFREPRMTLEKEESIPVMFKIKPVNIDISG